MKGIHMLAVNGKGEKLSKMVFYIVISVFILIIASSATVAVLNLASQKTRQTKAAPTLQSANNLKQQAFDALEKHDIPKAKNLFNEADKQYKQINKDSEKTQDQVDVEAQLYFLNHRGVAQ